MIFNDRQLIVWASSGGVTPFDPDLVNPASLDLRLGQFYRKPIFKTDRYQWSDEILIPKIGLALYPDDFLLCHSLETTSIPTNAVAKLFLKSSAGRKGIEHLHAGYGDPGFIGQWTFELKSHWLAKIILRTGDRLMQITLEECTGHAARPYGKTGHYQNQTGAQPSWENYGK